MPGPQNTLLIEGSFKELAEELAEYLDRLKKQQSDAASSLQTELSPLLEKLQGLESAEDTGAQDQIKDAILKQLIPATSVLNSAPEKEFIAAYNLVIHLINQSSNINQFLPLVCRNLSTEITSSPSNKFALALTVLSTVFNILDSDDGTRLRVLNIILDVVERSANFDTLLPQLKHLDAWLTQWEAEPAEQRQLYLAISHVAESAGDEHQAYEYLVRALRTVPSAEAASPEAQELSVRALKQALNDSAHFDFEDLSSLDSIQALRTSEPELYQLLEIFTADQLEDYNDFQDEHPGWLAKNELSEPLLQRKMRLLTLASLAASTGQSRSLAYSRIAEDLKVPLDDVEMWVIDVIRAGLVEGKLSQLNQTFLIHRSTYRVFGENQWREVASRLDMWRASLQGVLGVIRQEKEAFALQKEQEARALEAKANGALGMGGAGGYRRGGGGNHRDNHGTRDAMDVSLD